MFQKIKANLKNLIEGIDNRWQELQPPKIKPSIPGMAKVGERFGEYISKLEMPKVDLPKINLSSLSQKFGDYLKTSYIDYPMAGIQKTKEILTRPPGAYGSLDPGSGYGQFKQAQTTQGRPFKLDNDFLLNMAMMSSPVGAVKLSPFRGLGKDLARVGFKAEDIFKMTPKQGNEILVKAAAGGMRKMDQVKNVIKSSINRGNIDDAIKAQEEFDPGFTKVQSKVNFFDYFKTPENVLKKIGLADETKILRQSYDKYLDQLPQEIERISTWAKQLPRESSKRIFNYLDGKGTKLDSKEFQIAGEIGAYLNDWANKLKLPKFKRVSQYITHIFEKGSTEAEFNDEIAKLIDKKVAGSVYNPFLLARRGQRIDYIKDVWLALDAYTKRAVRKFNLDPALDLLQKKSQGLELSQYNFLQRLTAGVNLRPTETDTLIDNFIKDSPIGYRLGQRPVTALTQRLRQMVFRGTIGLNISSAVRNLTQAANTYSELGEKYTTIGYLKLARNWFSTELQRVGVLRDSFIQDRTLSVNKRIMEKADKVLFYMFEKAEKINRGAAYYGAKAKALAQGLPEEQAIQYAKELVRKTQFTFGSIDTPVALQSDLMKTAFQLQSYNIKQLEFLGGKLKAKDFAGLIRFIGSTLLMGKVLKDTFGMTIDVISLPSRLSPIMEMGRAGLQAVSGQTEEAFRSMSKQIPAFIPGGVQGKKTIEGLNALEEQGSYTESGRLRYPTQDDAMNRIRNILFGRYSTPEAQTYFNEELSPLGERQTDIYKSLEGQDAIDYYNSIIENRKAKQLNKVPEMEGVRAAETLELSRILQEKDKEALDRMYIKSLISAGTSEEDLQRLAEKRGIDLDSTILSIVKGLSVKDRAAYIETQLDSKDKYEVMIKEGVLTNAVVDEWLDQEKITREESYKLKAKIKGSTSKVAKGTKKTGTKKATKIKALAPFPKLKRIKINVSIPKLQAIKPLKVSKSIKIQLPKVKKVKIPKAKVRILGRSVKTL